MAVSSWLRDHADRPRIRRAASTFLLVFRNVFDEMIARRYHRHVEDGRALFPNFGNLLQSDMRRALGANFNTRWGEARRVSCVRVLHMQHVTRDLVRGRLSVLPLRLRHPTY